MKKQRTILIDDEKYARENLTGELIKFEETIAIIGEAGSVETAINMINERKPDLIFLDINLGDGTGFDVLEKVGFKKFKTVFLTAYDQYAIKALKINALDYLLKPLNKVELTEVIHKINLHEEQMQEQIKELLNQVREKSAPKKVTILSSDGLILYDIEEIIRCQSDGNYTIIYFKNKTKIISSKTLKHFDDMLSDLGFHRIHNSHLVNLIHLKRYINSDGGYLKMTDDSEVPISQRKKTQVLTILESL